MQQLRTIVALTTLALVTSCSEPTMPSEVDQRFADVVDMKVSASANQVTCLMYVQTYSGCQDARIVKAQQNEHVLEIGLSTFQSTRSDCDTLQSVKKLWHTFSNLNGNAMYTVRIRAERDSRTKKALDTLITVALP